MYFSPATGAAALESDILGKYESLGGPVGSDLGFPSANESDGGAGPASRIATFSGADKPAIFWTADHGAFVVRGAMKAAWDKLRGPAGKLGAPVGDQSANGDVVSQKFTGGKISWNRSKNTFITDPSNLAPLLSGLQVPGQNQPSASPTSAHTKGFVWQWWYLAAGIGALLLLLLLGLLAFGWRRRRRRAKPSVYEPEHGATRNGVNGVNDNTGFNGGYDGRDDGQWLPRDPDEVGAEHFASGEGSSPLTSESAQRVSWRRRSDTVSGMAEDAGPAGLYDSPSESNEGADDSEDHFEGENDDPDAVDTTPTPVISEVGLAEATFADAAYPDLDDPEVVTEDAGYPEVVSPDDDYPDLVGQDASYPVVVEQDATYTDVVAEDGGYPDVAVPHAAPDVGSPYAAAEFGTTEAGYQEAGYAGAGYPEPGYSDAGYAGTGYADASYADAGYADASYADAGHQEAGDAGTGYQDAAYAEPGYADARYSDAAYPDVAVPHSGPDVGYAEAGDDYSAGGAPETEPEPEPETSTGRHAAMDTEQVAGSSAAAAPVASPAARPTLHLPLDDPYQAPEGYPVKASLRFGLYYTPQSPLYHDTVAEIWFISEDVAQANGFSPAE